MSLARPGRKQATATEDFDFHIYNHNWMNISTFYIRGADKSLARPGREKIQRQKILNFIYPIYIHNWRNISSIFVYNKTSIKRNILTMKQNTPGSKSG